MKKSVAILVSMMLLGWVMFFMLDRHKLKTQVRESAFFQPEIDSRFLLTVNNSLVYSANEPGKGQMYKNNTQLAFKTVQLSGNAGFPFVYKGRVTNLQDNEGDENFRPVDSILNRTIRPGPMKKIFSFNNGYLLVYHLQNDDRVYTIDFAKRKESLLISNIQILHQVLFSEFSKTFIVNYDDKLIQKQLYSGVENVLVKNDEMTNLNPFLKGNDLYFSSNINSDFYQILRIDLDDRTKTAQVVLQGDHDLRMPKLNQDELYYLEVIDNEYLLKHLNLHTNEIRDITTSGVVFNYEFANNDRVIFSYSDFYTPKSLCFFDLKRRSIQNLTNKEVKHNLRLTFLPASEVTSAAYRMDPAEKKIKGAVLFVHPGTDFSPRWDPILMNIVSMGYILIAPNYSGSSGYGKKFFSLGYGEATSDIRAWTNRLLKEYPHLPLYYLTYSSGNLVMEKALNDNDLGVTAAISLFGLPNDTPPTFTVPCLYFLGENDSRVNFRTRMSDLNSDSQLNHDLTISHFSDEGHFFKKTKNLSYSVFKILDFMQQNN